MDRDTHPGDESTKVIVDKGRAGLYQHVLVTIVFPDDVNNTMVMNIWEPSMSGRARLGVPRDTWIGYSVPLVI